MVMKLHGGRVSPYYERVLLVLDIKDMRGAIEEAGVPGGLPASPEYRAINPIGKIPALVLEDGTVLPESEVICRYLDRLKPEPPLIPGDPRAAADVELACRLVDLYVAPALVPLFQATREGWAAGERLDAAIAGLATALDHLEHYMRIAAPGGDAGWTLADVTLLPVFFYVVMMGGRYGFDPFAERPRIAAWHRGIMESPRARTSCAGMQEALQAFLAARGQGAGDMRTAVEGGR